MIFRYPSSRRCGHRRRAAGSVVVRLVAHVFRRLLPPSQQFVPVFNSCAVGMKRIVRHICFTLGLIETKLRLSTANNYEPQS